MIVHNMNVVYIIEGYLLYSSFFFSKITKSQKRPKSFAKLNRVRLGELFSFGGKQLLSFWVVVDMQSEEEKDQTSDREAIDNLIAEQEIFEKIGERGSKKNSVKETTK